MENLTLTSGELLKHSTAMSINVSDRSGILVFVLISMVSLAVWGAFIPPTLTHNAWIYSWDSASYIETAESILAGRGLVHRTIFGLDPNIWEPLKFWPPGYPVLIALGQLSGLSPMTSALVIPLLSAGIVIILLTKICSTMFDGSWVLTLPVVLISVCMPAFLYISTSALSDMSYLALATASLACLLSWSSRPNASWKLVAGAGLLAGLSWNIRNTALALFAATAIFLFCHFFWLRFRNVMLISAAWFTGVMIGCGPALIRNLVMFGQINPYNAPSSEMSLREVLSAARAAILTDLTKSDNTAAWIGEMADKRLLIITALVVIISLWLWMRRMSLQRVREVFMRQKHHILLVSYLVIYMGMLVIARTRYWLSDFPGGAAPRHFLQIYWIIWVYFAIVGVAVLNYCGLPRAITKGIVIACLLLAAVPQVKSQFGWFKMPIETRSIDSMIGSQAAAFLTSAARDDQIILSMNSYMLRLYLGLNARKIAGESQCQFQPCFTRDDINQSGQSGLLWGLVIDNVAGARKGKYGPFYRDIVERPQNYPELARIQIPGPALILKYVGKPTASDG